MRNVPRSIRLSLLLSLCVLAPAQSATAQDGYRWSGLYYGVAFGAAHTNTSATETFNSTSSSTGTSFNAAGAVTGSSISSSTSTSSSSGSGSGWGGLAGDALVGYQTMAGSSLLIGAQLEGSLSDIRFSAAGTGVQRSTNTSTSFSAVGAVTGTNSGTITSTFLDTTGTKLNSSASLMARIGMLATPGTLLYGIGGVTYGSFGNSGFDNDSFNRWGWALGGGIEQKVSSNWSVRLEYRYTDFGSGGASSASETASNSPNVSRNAAGAVTGSSVSNSISSSTGGTDFDLSMHTIKLGIVTQF